MSNNVKLWDRTIEDYEMILACRDAGIHDTISEREGAYESPILPGGRNFSGGQLQRIEIARVLAQGPIVLILDEATSALDNKTQKQVSDSLAALDCTRIVVAHRLSTVRHCDRILVVDGGKIVEEGTYEDLIAAHGLFADLVERQRLDREA